MDKPKPGVGPVMVSANATSIFYLEAMMNDAIIVNCDGKLYDNVLAVDEVNGVVLYCDRNGNEKHVSGSVVITGLTNTERSDHNDKVRSLWTEDTASLMRVIEHSGGGMGYPGGEIS